MRRGFAPSPFPTAGTTFPLDTFLYNASLFSFSRGRLYSMAKLHVAREFTVVVRPIRDKALHRIKCFMSI